MKKTISNRRNDPRLHLPDVQIRVRKQSLGGSTFVDCQPIDVSQSGLAFTSDELDFDLLQKIYIELSVGHRKIEGKALICHIVEKDEVTQYGVLFIDVTPSVEEALSLESLSSTRVKDFSASIAENMVLNLKQKLDDKRLKKAQIHLFDGVDAFKKRLIELVKDDVDNQGKPYQLGGLFEFDTHAMSVTVPMKDADGALLTRCTIKPVLAHGSKKLVFETDTGRTFSNLFDVLQEISDTFHWILSEQI
ncbi:hypothetical protein A9Q82_00170 [Cycloclasticus sp. 46_120_T64]|nr:hypothetical protein A9Q82_00170 [Cycloclasticus sp. 46_120_T64]